MAALTVVTALAIVPTLATLTMFATLAALTAFTLPLAVAAKERIGKMYFGHAPTLNFPIEQGKKSEYPRGLCSLSRCGRWSGYCAAVPHKTYKVQLSYFRQTGMFLTTTVLESAHEEIMEIWEEVDDLRRFGRLPGLRSGSGRDLFILVDVPDHPQRVLHLVRPSFHDEDDVTPLRIPTGERTPLVRVPLVEIPRTSTRDVIKPPEGDDEVDTVVLTGDEGT